jgi:hypothetical protein
MKSRIGMIGVALAGALACGSLAHSTFGQAPQQDALSTLLVEVRALRGAIEQMASAGARVQLAMGRLQLQEQRVNTLARRLEEVRRSRVVADQKVSDDRNALVETEERLRRIADPAERQAFEQRSRELKLMIARDSAELQRLAAEETELSGVIAVEQRRWTDINSQLEDLDRALRRP